jgi:uncharacterized protein YlxW (UPF0749 family)
MLTTENLRTQLDALKTKLYGLEVENQRLWDERPEQAAAVDLEDELKQAQEENVRLSQRVNKLSDSLSEKDVEGTSGRLSTEVAELRQKLARSEEEAAGLRLR